MKFKAVVIKKEYVWIQGFVSIGVEREKEFCLVGLRCSSTSILTLGSDSRKKGAGA